MTLFEFLVNLNSRNKQKKTSDWIETSAVFTGRRNQAATKTRGGYILLDYYEYEISYYTGDKKQRAWYTFHPLPDPEVTDIEGQTIRIKYNKRKPYMFEEVTTD